MKPEEKARQRIDTLLEEAGWYICDRKDFSTEHNAIALREALMKGGKEADYLLFINGKAVGVLEAKREEDKLGANVSLQAESYCRKPMSWYAVYEKPLPLVYISNGYRVLFKNLRNKDEEYTEIKSFHSPKNIVDILGIESEYAGLASLPKDILRDCQYEAILNLEKSFKEGKRKALIVLATGAGKTYTACMFSYRFLAYTKAKRILFLVDRRNLGNQAKSEYTSFITPEGDKFSDLYMVQNLEDNKLQQGANVVITTIQKLYSVLTGRQLDDNDDIDSIDSDDFDNSAMELGDNLYLERNYFDYIIIDECHRSIYGRWRAVLDYFDSARFIGLTATPIPDTAAFFNNNIVINYTLEKSVRDGINVYQKTYKIQTRITEDGTTIKSGDDVLVHENYSKNKYKTKTKHDKTYTSTQINRDIFERPQIRLILNTFKDIVYTELYPDRKPEFNHLPKTLIFAENDKHADIIVEEIRNIFSEQCEDFVKKITYSAGDSDTLIRQFRNDKNFRIAVTVNLIATGTDIKPLEIIIFMRDVRSETFYIQMKGRGVRSISTDKLQNVTPNADSKDFYYLIDAAGVTESDKIMKVVSENANEHLTLERLLEEITHGKLPDDYISALGFKISTVNRKAEEDDREEFRLISGYSMAELIDMFLNAVTSNSLPPYNNINEPNTERKELVKPLTSNPQARQLLLKICKGSVIYADTNKDSLIYAGFWEEEAKDNVTLFEKYITENKDKVEALQLIYNGAVEKLTYEMLQNLTKTLIKASEKYTIDNLWKSYKLIYPKNVHKLTRKEEINIITNIISLIRFAYKHSEFLRPISANSQKYFGLWLGHIKQNYGELNEAQIELARSISEDIIKNGALSEEVIKQNNTNIELYKSMKTEFGRDKINNILVTLSKFMLAS